MIPYRRSRLDRRSRQHSRVLESPRAPRGRSPGYSASSLAPLAQTPNRAAPRRPSIREARSPFQSAEDGGRRAERMLEGRVERTPTIDGSVPGARWRGLVPRPTVRGLSSAGRRPSNAGGWGGVRPVRCGAVRSRCCDSFLSAVARSSSEPTTETVQGTTLTTETTQGITRKPTTETNAGNYEL